jgi:hypothetical protein
MGNCTLDTKLGEYAPVPKHDETQEDDRSKKMTKMAFYLIVVW